MKITINRIVFNELHTGQKIFMPSIGVLWLNEGTFSFHNNDPQGETVSILDLIQNTFNIDYDTAYTRYQFWRRAVTVVDGKYEVIKIDDVCVIVIDEYENYNYEASPRLYQV